MHSEWFHLVGIEAIDRTPGLPRWDRWGWTRGNLKANRHIDAGSGLYRYLNGSL